MPIAKPSVEDVRAILETPLNDASIQTAIDDAALIAARCVENLDADRQKAILKYVAAHLISTRSDSGVVQSLSLGDASVTYARAMTGAGLMATSYGMQAILLDPNDCLIRLGKGSATLHRM